MAAVRAAPDRFVDPRAGRPVAAAVAVGMAAALGLAAAQAARSSPVVTGILVLAIASPLIALAVGGLRRLLIALAILDISLNWDTNFSYHFDLASFGAVGGLSLSLATVALAGLYVLWLGELLMGPVRSQVQGRRWALPLLVYILVVTASAAIASRKDLALFGVIMLAQAFLLFVYLVSWTTTRDRLRFVVTVLITGLGLQGTLILLTQYTGLNLDLPGLATAASETGERAIGTTGSPNTTGLLLAGTLLMAVALFLGKTAGYRAVLVRGAALVGSVALILTLSRGAWLAFAIGTIALLLMFAAKERLSRRVVGLVVGAALLAAVFGGVVEQRVSSNSDSALARIPLAATAFEIIEDHPLWGVGANNYVVTLPRYEELDQYAYVPHNKFLLVWAEAGLAGLIAFVFLVVTWLRRAFIAASRSSPDVFPLAAGVAASLLAIAIDMNFEPFNGRSELGLFVVLGALATNLFRPDLGLASDDAPSAARGVNPPWAASLR